MAKRELEIAVVGKYFDTGDFMLLDAYVSVIEAVKFFFVLERPRGPT